MTGPRTEEVAADQGDTGRLAPPLLDRLLSWKHQKWGAPHDVWRALVPGMAHRLSEVTQTFLDVVTARQIPNTRVREANLEFEGEARSYHILGQQLGGGALAVMAVRTAKYGNDLYAEWAHFVFRITILPLGGRLAAGVVALLILPLLVLVFVLAVTFGGEGSESAVLLEAELALLSAVFRGRVVDRRATALKGYQRQDAWAFKEAVCAALKEALDLVGISDEMLREMPAEKRVI